MGENVVSPESSIMVQCVNIIKEDRMRSKCLRFILSMMSVCLLCIIVFPGNQLNAFGQSEQAAAKPGKMSKRIFKKSATNFIINTDDDTAVEIYAKAGTEPTGQYLGYGNVIETAKVLKGWAEFEYQKYDWETQKESKAVGYVNAQYLHPEPVYAVAEKKMTVIKPEIEVFLLPDTTSRKVLLLFRGEVVDAVGETAVEGSTWVKLKFESEGERFDQGAYAYIVQRNRFGWVNSNEVALLEQGKVDESSLNISEIPTKMRASDKKEWTQTEREALAKNGFYAERVAPPKQVYIDDMIDAYQSMKSAKFISTDLFMHSWYLIFDRMLQDIEENKLAPAVKEITMGLISAIQDEIQHCNEMQYQNTKVCEALNYDLIYYSVAMKLFEPAYVVDKEIKNEVKALVNIVINAKQESLPAGKYDKIMNEMMLNEDVTQYVVRGHYEKNESLKRYFRGMMWYGRKMFYIDKNVEVQPLAMIMASRFLEQNAALMEKYQRFNAIIDVLIGKSNAWTPQDCISVMKDIYPPSDWQDSNKFNDEGKLKKFKEKASTTLPPLKIHSVPTVGAVAGFKFLGQRFTWDAYFLNTVSKLMVPSAIDVMQVLGSDTASKVDGARTQNLKTTIDDLKKTYNGEIAVDKNTWVYAGWLDTLTAMFGPSQSKQVFANSNGWKYKNLNTALGSWSELKYSTILYAEQSYAEGGDGENITAPPYLPPRPRGYVEPNPVLWARLSELVKQTQNKLQDSNFLTDKYKDRLLSFEKLLQEAKAIAEKEVKGEPITGDDYLWIDTMSNRLDVSLILGVKSGEDSAAIQTSPDLVKMAIIADVHTDPPRILLEATGAPLRLFVVGKDASGGTRITQGYLYSWYEFMDAKRWQASEWKKLVYDEANQAQVLKYQPTWYKEFVLNY
jgi:Protein of unknown function (DUF3160)